MYGELKKDSIEFNISPVREIVGSITPSNQMIKGIVKSTTSSVIGTLSAGNIAEGNIAPSSQKIKGGVKSTNSVSGALNVGDVIKDLPDYYEGDYEITPSTEDQLLKTENKMLTQDLMITAVPYAEVTNEQNGITITIGG